MTNEEREREIQENEKLLPRPSFLKRLLAGLLDIVFFFVSFFALQVVSFYGVYKPLGYQESIDSARTMCVETHLYTIVNEKEIVPIKDTYSDLLTPEKNLDEPITYFYSTNERARFENKLVEYETAKLATGFFERNSDGEVVRRANVVDSNVKEVLLKELDKALDYFEKDPTYLDYLRKPYYIKTFSDIIICAVSSIFVYFIPMISSKGGETLGQRIFKIAIADRRTNTYAKKSMIFVRYLVFALFNIMAPVLLFISIEYLALIPIFITMIMMSFSKIGTTVHGIISKTYVVLKSSLVTTSRSNRKNNNKQIEKKEYGLQHI